MAWSVVADHALAWLPSIRQLDPELVDETAGIAAGAGRSLGEIIALNARGEMVYGNYLPDLVDGCTSYALLPDATPDGHVYCGQNWDWRHGVADTWVALHVRQPGKPTVTMVVEAGQVGRHGVNSMGVALLANGLGGFCTPVPAVPQPYIRRRVLDMWTFSEALEVAVSVPRQIAANLLLVHRDGFAIDIEATPKRRAFLYPEDGILVHGNHYEGFSWAHDGPEYKPYGADSLYRVFQVREGLKRVRTVDQKDVVSGVRAVLSDHFGYPDSVCAHPDDRKPFLDRWQTLTSSVIDLTAGEWWMAPGTPCDRPFEPLPWNLYDL